ncbi:sigma-70 family RNA polymerase sigma factor [Sphingobacterium alkalisoli]|uniref:Sigma-70 family RNA polymerase sigma factor n=1 Tax=Sphingobacterium alkalisoli TaxID=1874115 RepID=A0A4U0H916_9SPHI|nr:sigma-70 family RNA polymerase sigma factor [Sphingobacterium alkalisoli]TJY68375.1 sigma-70 family RNA polymerase sigma factor [Sphingobacterium alkalisoli]GGH06928.1 DNA-directed RNA polymerase sigma-70 factor [Sphingobacterium alkalisoli]
MDEAVFLALISEHQGIIHKVCRLYRDIREDREDLFQEITFQLWKSHQTFKNESKISTWIYRIALNTAIASFRKKKHAIEYSPVLPDLADEQPDEELAIRQERLFNALKRLNDADKAIITLYLEDLSYQQIAEITGISENNVGVKLNRIKIKIKNFLNN